MPGFLCFRTCFSTVALEDVRGVRTGRVFARPAVACAAVFSGHSMGGSSRSTAS
jgi:hypothetical protein